jgi:hypothetical protein
MRDHDRVKHTCIYICLNGENLRKYLQDTTEQKKGSNLLARRSDGNKEK